MSRLPPPRSISPQAQAAVEAAEAPSGDYPAITDIEGWRRHIADYDAALAEMMRWAPVDERVRSCWGELAAVPVVHVTPAEYHQPAGKLYLDIHGGALAYLGGAPVETMARGVATRIGADLVSIDYRMPPDHPYPAALDDCLAVYTELLRTAGARNIAIGGVSAGGNLAAALLMRARDEGLPMPASLVLMTPELDLTESGDSFQTLLGLDRMGLLTEINRLYAAGHPLDHSYLSPLFGNVTGFPPTFLQAGTRDLFLSNTVRMHRALRKAGVATDLHIWEAMPHGGFMGAPEDDEVTVELRAFLASHWG